MMDLKVKGLKVVRAEEVTKTNLAKKGSNTQVITLMNTLRHGVSLNG